MQYVVNQGFVNNDNNEKEKVIAAAGMISSESLRTPPQQPFA